MQAALRGAVPTLHVENGVILLKRYLRLPLCLLFCLLTACGGVAEPAEPESSGQTVEIGGQTVDVDEDLEQSGFTEADFSVDEATGRVVCLSQEALTGIDVSSHQGEIDWAAVAGDGISFAMLRIGYRGYTQGGINQDECFESNLAGATENGLSVGAYFFSQAISAEEAEEEADFVLSVLDGRSLELPVVFDWEEITQEEARTDGLDTDTLTACALAFCQRIQEAGYACAIYCNGSVGYLRYDISQLQGLDVWYAEYGDWPSFAYAFDLWQYSKTGAVEGISGSVDLDLYFPE